MTAGPPVHRRPRGALATLLLVAVIGTMVVGAPPASADRSTRAEQRLLSLMERDRAAAGAPSWGRAEDLTDTAVRWSARLADEYGAQGGQRHNPDLRTEVCCARRVAENVGWTSGGHDDLDGAIDRLHAAFMRSEGHRANVLHGSHTHVGVGVELHGSGNLYVTVVFREPDGSAPAASEDRSGGGSSSPGPRPTSSPAAAATSAPAAEPTTNPTATADRSEPATTAAEPRTDDGAEAPASEPDASPSDDLLQGRDADELARLAAWVLAEHERLLEEDAQRELEALLATLGAAPAKLVDALRRALKLVPPPGPPGTGRPTAAG